jgi:ubiquinone/menaquinone biosynthesis C-methylase UbiE
MSRQHDPVGIIHDLEGAYALAQHLQRNGYLKHRFHKLLDVGCGGLGLGILWLLQSEKAYGLDPLPVLSLETGCKHIDEFVDRVQENTNYSRAKAEAMPYDDGFFDCVVCNNVIDHVNDPSAILKEIKRVLSPDGLFAFAVETHSIRTLLWKKILKKVCPNYGSLPGHPYEWTEKQMSEVLIESGFIIDSHMPRSRKGYTLGRVRMTTWLLRHA